MLLQGVSRRLQSGLTDAPSQRQGKRVACAFSRMVVELHHARKRDQGAGTEDAATSEAAMHADREVGGDFMPAEDPGVLYMDEDLSLLHDEHWWTLSDSQHAQHAQGGFAFGMGSANSTDEKQVRTPCCLITDLANAVVQQTQQIACGYRVSTRTTIRH